MERQRNAASVIIRRKKVEAAHEGGHGGAWKIAFADFATAMMAFFLVMWLVNATTESQRKGLADYFSPSIPVNRISGGGDGAFGGHDVFSQDVLANSGRGEGGGEAGETRKARNVAAGGERALTSGERGVSAELELGSRDALAEIADILQGRGGESMASELALRHVVTRLTDEGLIVEIFDLPDQMLFVGDTDTPEPVLEVLAGLVGEVFGLVGNGIAIEGHLRSFPVVLAVNPVWDLSTSRAQRMRALLQAEGLSADRMRRVTGHADRQPATRNPAAPRNNRLEVILLRDQT